MNIKFWEPKIVIKTIEIDRPLNEIELATKLAELLGDIDSVEITTEAQKQIFLELSRIDGYLDFLRDTMAMDIKRYFTAQNDRERDIIRGGFSRTAYLRAGILDSMSK